MQGGGYKYNITTPSGKIITDKLRTYKKESFESLLSQN